MSITTTITGKSGREHRLSVDYEGGVVDEGIGYYEYGSASGIDVQMVPEVESFSVDLLWRGKRRNITAKTSQELDSYIVGLCEDEILDDYKNGGYE